MSNLLAKKCIPCEGGVDPLTGDALKTIAQEVPLWRVADDQRSILREFAFADFVEAIVFITDVAHVAEEEGHHPDLNLHDYNKVAVTLSTHAIKGLSENDFIMAAKIDAVRSDTLAH